LLVLRLSKRLLNIDNKKRLNGAFLIREIWRIIRDFFIKLTVKKPALCYHARAAKLAVHSEIFMNNTDHPPSMEGEK
jgi:hypothetical protein